MTARGIAEAVFLLGCDIAGGPPVETDAALCEDGRTVMIYARGDGGEWCARYFDLPALVSQSAFDAAPYEAAARRLLSEAGRWLH